MSSADKVVEIQHQVKQNTDELHDFLRDLGSWQKEMDAKDAQLKMSRKVDKKESSDVQPTTSSLSTRRENGSGDESIKFISEVDSKKKSSKDSGSKDKAKPKDVDEPKSKKIKSYDYQAWDKFDVDKALEEMDDGKSEGTEEENSEEEELVLMQQAVVEKEKGNEYFKKGDFTKAIDCYTKGIQCDPANPVLPANRAMALLKIGNIATAEVDCTLAISLDPTYVKAYHRRANARVQLKRFAEAVQDFDKVLELEPKNKTAKAELEKLKEQMAEPMSKSETKPTVAEKTKTEKLEMTFKENLKASFAASTDKRTERSSSEIQEVFAIDKKPHQRSKKPLHRIEIVDVDEETQMFDKKSEKIELFTPLEESEIKMSATNDSIVASNKIEILSSTNEENIGKQEAVVDIVEHLKTDNVASVLQQKVEEEIMSTLTKKLSIDDAEKKAFKFCKAPKTSVQFLSEWRQLNNVVEGRSKYIRLLSNPDKDYVRIFKHSMDAGIFTEIIETLASKFVDNLSSHVLGLSRVPRMSTLVMFLDDQSQLEKLVQVALVQEGLGASERKEIEKVFQF